MRLQKKVPPLKGNAELEWVSKGEQSKSDKLGMAVIVSSKEDDAKGFGFSKHLLTLLYFSHFFLNAVKT